MIVGTDAKCPTRSSRTQRAISTGFTLSMHTQQLPSWNAVSGASTIRFRMVRGSMTPCGQSGPKLPLCTRIAPGNRTL